MSGPQISWLPDGKRVHMNHGPIDLIVRAFGGKREMHAAYAQAAARFRSILQELADELPALRLPATIRPRHFAGPVANSMEQAVVPHAKQFITPMAAVAGSVADNLLGALVAGRTLSRAYVNDGGDIAVHLSPGAVMNVAIAGTAHGLADRLTLCFDDRVRGIATSGWRGRSFSLGIADAVTVLAGTAARADAAATVIANAVDLPGHSAVERRPACKLSPDSDLGARMVTTGVGRLRASDRAEALDAGLEIARDLQRRGLIVAAALFLGEDARVCGELAGGMCSTEGGATNTNRAIKFCAFGHD